MNFLHINRHKTQKRLFFRKVLLAFLVTFTLLFFIFFSIIVGGLNTRYKTNQTKNNDTSVQNSESIARTLLKDIVSNTAYSFSSDQEVQNILYSQDLDATAQIKAKNTIDSLKSSSRYIKSVYMINFISKKVMTNYQFYDLDSFFDQDILTQIQDQTPAFSAFLFVPRSVNRYKVYGDTNPNHLENVWSIIYYSNQAGAMVINVDSSAFASLLNSNADTGSFVFLNQNDQILASSSTDEFGTVFDNEKILNQLQEQTADAGHFNTKHNGSTYTVNYSKSSFGLVLLHFQPYTVFETTNGLLGVSLAISVLYFFLCLILTLIVSTILYRPVDSLKKAMAENFSDIRDLTDEDEFSMFSNAYQLLSAKNSHLAHYKEAYLSQSQENALLRFMQGGISAITCEAYNELTEHFSFSCFQVVMIEIDTQKTDLSGSLIGNPDNIELVMFAISNVADELLQSTCAYRKIQPNYSRYIYILNFQQDQVPVLDSLLVKLQSSINELFHVSFSIGTGPVVDDFDNLPAAKSEAENHLNKRFIDGFNSIHEFNTDDAIIPCNQVYPFELETELLSALKSQNLSKTQQILDRFFTQIATYSYSQAHLYLMWLNYNIQRFGYTNHLEVETFDIDDACTLPDIHALLENHCSSFIRFMEDNKKIGSEHADLIDQINVLINENLCNPNLSVVYLANEVKLSVNYLRSIYKEQTGNSLSIYINEKKLELIYRLLLETDQPIQDISDQLGFTTKNYFFTFFKKHTGMTPSQYRNIHNHKE